MRKIAFYLDKGNLEQLDYSTFKKGNPGMGGSEYEFLLVSQLLRERNNGLEIILLSETKLPPPIYAHRVNGMDNVCSYCRENKYDVLVINQAQYETFRCADNYGIYVILWIHNMVSDQKLIQWYKDSRVLRLVFCGREHLEYYYDHVAMRKSKWIYNIFPVEPKEWYVSKMKSKDNHNVVYMGAIASGKGFHLLAQAWPYILSKIPDAQLYVIGSGRLYDKKAKMGRYGIASQDYEDVIMPSLTDDTGKIIDSVHFLGILGNEKYNNMGRCKVGVPNPSGQTETFCLTAIEMQLMGCSLTTIHHMAYLDTIYNQRFLYNDKKKLAEYVVNRLLADPDNFDDLYSFITHRFSMNLSLERWEKLFLDINSRFIDIEPYSENFIVRKKVKSIILKMKMVFPPLAYFPILERWMAFIDRLEGKSNN